MKMTRHIAASAVAGAAVYQITGSPPMAASLFLGGVFIDLDHVFDYLILAKERHTLRNFFSWFNDIRWKRIIIMFHSYEFYAFLLLAAFWLKNDILTGLAIGIGIHFVMDQIAVLKPINGVRLSRLFYFLSFRYVSHFELKKMRSDAAISRQ
jgi:hypothetical protein